MKRSRARRTTTMETELIPGLPDCLALECLLRLPFHAILDARAVCKRWKYELDSLSFYRIRRADGLTRPVVSLLLRGKIRHTVGKFHLALYEPDTGVCTMRQLAPDRPRMRQLPPDRTDCLNLKIGSIAGIVGRELVVIFGWDAMKNRRTGEVHFYDLLSGAWRPGAPNPAPQRSLSRNVFRGDKLFVIGGRDGGGKKLRSALVYDVPTDTWIKIPDLEGLGSLLDGSFYYQDEIIFWRAAASDSCEGAATGISGERTGEGAAGATMKLNRSSGIDEGPDADFLEKKDYFMEVDAFELPVELVEEKDLE
ncbi:hypothetical protein ZIOFF_033917 [Zingiber officinale]|uniref:F-box domain-containing protein n=1 Tax=Zingiber officinale TaxID=94328 RepID=A0A8J5GXP4_ZINOF|nr:hypothetical protein ZIOFF_033917 [Zingiber officinale]